VGGVYAEMIGGPPAAVTGRWPPCKRVITDHEEPAYLQGCPIVLVLPGVFGFFGWAREGTLV